MALSPEHAAVTMAVVLAERDTIELAAEYGITTGEIMRRVKYTLICMGFPIERYGRSPDKSITVVEAIHWARRDPMRLSSGLRAKLNPMFDHEGTDTPAGFYYNELLKR